MTGKEQVSDVDPIPREGRALESVNLNEDLRAKLRGLRQQLMLCDETGWPLGVFLPLEAYHELLRQLDDLPTSPEELERRRKEAAGCSLQEFWERMHSQ